MNIIPSKTERQEIGIRRWADNKGIGTFNWVMQFGKTRAGCIIASRVHNRHPKPILVAVMNVVIKQNWIATIQEVTNLILDQDIFVLTAKEISNRITNGFPIDVSLMIVDEIHRFTSDSAYKIFSTVKYTFILGLTGTYPTKGEEKRMLDKYCPIIDEITEQEALANNWIAPFNEYNILLDLPQEDKDRYEKFTNPIRDILKQFKDSHKLFRIGNSANYLIDSDYNVIQSCVTGVNYKYDGGFKHFSSSDIRDTLASLKGWNKDLDLSNDLSKEIDELWNPTNLERRAKHFTEMIKRRNDLLISHPLKLQAVLEIFNRNPVNTICFNENTDFADSIAEQINKIHGDVAVVYHSNITSRPVRSTITGEIIRTKAGAIKLFGKTTLRKIAIEGLHTGRYKFLCTAKALDEGVSIPELRQVITTAGTTNPTQYKQRSGRGKTVDIYDSNKMTNIFNICFNDFIGSEGNIIHSRDLQKLSLRQGSNYINATVIVGIDEIQHIVF